jgi:hypothetical protein
MARTFVQSLQADMGGTDLFAPLRSLHLLSGAASARPSTSSRLPRNVFLFSDGQINDEEHVGRAIAQHCQLVRLFAFGFGSNARYVFVLACAL